MLINTFQKFHSSVRVKNWKALSGEKLKVAKKTNMVVRVAEKVL